MKKAAVSLIAGLIVVFLIIVLNSLCAGCVYAQQTPVPASARTSQVSQSGNLLRIAQPYLSANDCRVEPSLRHMFAAVGFKT